MKTAVVGYDGSVESHDALALAARLMQGFGGRLVIVVVDEIHLLTGNPPGEEATKGRLQGLLDDGLGRVDGQKADGLIIWGSVPECLEVIADDVSADLIAVGSTHRGPVGRVAPGSVGDRLLAGAPCAVAIAPRGYAADGDGIERIGVGFNGEAESGTALRFADQIAAATEASLTLVAVAPEVRESSGRISHTGAGYARILEDYLKTRLGEAANGCSSGAAISEVLEVGDPSEVLIRRSTELDLLVLGSRGYGPLRRVLLGGVASEVIRDAACPVIVTPRSAEKSRLRLARSAPADQA